MDPTRSVYAWTPPNEIEGTPDEVREAVIQQLGEFGGVLGEVIITSAVQIRSADIGEILSRSGPKSDVPPLVEWSHSEQGRAVRDMRDVAADLIRAISNVIRTYK